MTEACAPSTSYRLQILERLDSRDKSLNDVRRMFKHYSLLADRTSIEQSRSSNVANSNSTEPNAVEVANLKEEISRVYKLKSINDQELIEANRKLTDIVTNMQGIEAERTSLKQQVTQLRQHLEKSESELDDLKADNVLLLDEKNAIFALCTQLGEQKTRMEKECDQLIVKITELSEKHAEYMNAEVALQERKRELKIQEDVRRAIQDVADDRSDTSKGATSPDSSADDILGDIIPCKAKFKVVAHEGEVTDAEWINDTMFVTCGSDNKVRVWNTDAGAEPEKLCSLTGMNAGALRVDVDERRRLVLAASVDKTARLWNVDSQRLLATFQSHTDKVSAARFYEDHQIVTGSFDRTIKLWNMGNGRCERTLFPGSMVLDLVIGPPNFISSHLDKSIRFWDIRQSEAVKILPMGYRVTSLDLSMDKTQLLCTTRDDTLTVLDLRTYQNVHNYAAEDYKVISDLTRSVFSSTGEYVASGSATGCVYIWNTKTTRLETVLKGSHTNPILSVAWNPSGRGIISCERLKSVVNWR